MFPSSQSLRKSDRSRKWTAWLVHLSLLIFHSSLLAQSDLNITLASGQVNTLTLQTSASTDDRYLAFESDGVSINDQIDFRYPEGFEIRAINVPDGWSFQDISVSSVERVATWFYLGSDAANPAEFYDFSTALDFQFQVTSGSEVQTLELTLQAQLSVFRSLEDQLVRAFINESRTAAVQSQELIRFRSENGLSADGSQDTADANQDGVSNLLHYAFGLGPVSSSVPGRDRFPSVTPEGGTASVSFVRHRNPSEAGLNYRIQVSGRLEGWNDVINLPIPSEVTSLDSDYERIEYQFPENEVAQFYRLAIDLR